MTERDHRSLADVLDAIPVDSEEALAALKRPRRRRRRGRATAGLVAVAVAVAGIGVLVWAFLMSLAVFLGLAFAAQLEAVRAGQPVPITGEQVNREGLQPRRSSLRSSRMLGTWR